MGTKMWKRSDLPRVKSGALAVLSIAFLLGGGAGCLFAALSGEEGAQELSRYLADYLALAQEGGLPRSLWPVLWGQMKYLLIALVLGLTAVGVVGLPVLFGVRGFLFTFPVACFCRVFGGSGLFPAFILFGLPALLWSAALFLMGAAALPSALQLLESALGEGRGGALPGGAYWFRAGLCAGLGLAAALLEHWVVPVLLRAAARVML